MKVPEFMDSLCTWARTGLASKCTNVLTGAAIGAASCGVGRRILESKIVPLLSLCVDANGDIDIPGLRESVYAGFEVAKSVPVLGGIISVDVQDARDFFATLPEQS